MNFSSAVIFSSWSDLLYFSDLEDYDFIVVGSGTAGSIVAARLSEVSHWKVLVLEAGDYGNDFTDIPGMNGYIAKTKYNWGYKTTQQSHACLGILIN